jgi:hypothetical protein
MRVWVRAVDGVGVGDGLFGLEAVDTIKHSDSARHLCFSPATQYLTLPTIMGGNGVVGAGGDALGGGDDGDHSILQRTASTASIRVYYLAACSDKGQIKMWAIDADTGKRAQLLPVLTYSIDVGAAATLAFSSSAEELLYSTSGFVVTLALKSMPIKGDAKKPQAKFSSKVHHLQPIMGNRRAVLETAEQLPDRVHCLCANDHGVFLWDRNTQAITSLIEGYNACSVAVLSQSPDDGPSSVLVASGSNHGEVVLWELGSWLQPPGTSTTSAAGAEDAVLDHSKRRRQPRQHETREAQEKEFEIRQGRRLQQEEMECNELIAASEGPKKGHGAEESDDDAEETGEEDEDLGGTEMDADTLGTETETQGSDAGGVGGSEGRSEGGGGSRKRRGGGGEDAEKGPNKVLLQDKEGHRPREKKWATYLHRVIMEGGVLPTEVVALTSTGRFSATKLQKAFVL